MCRSIEGLPVWAGAPSPETLHACFRVRKEGLDLPAVKLTSNVSFGRKSDLVEVVLEHSSISRRHAVILHRNSDGTLHIMDLGSAHGTMVNGVTVTANEPCELQDGDMVQFGRSTRKYMVDMQRPSPAASSLTMAPPPNFGHIAGAQ